VERREYLIIASGIILLGLAISVAAIESFDRDSEGPTETGETTEWQDKVSDTEPAKATFAGGCFWCIEAVYENEIGVAAAISGYAGGKESTATYKQTSTGETDHREAVKVRYYPSLISYEELLDMYWKSIDPTDPNGQFSDRGPQYTTAIYAHSERQYRLAKQSKENLSESGKFDDTIVTEIKNYTTFFRAEDRHQNYSEKNTYRYEVYKESSGRKGFVEKVWENSPIN